MFLFYEQNKTSGTIKELFIKEDGDHIILANIVADWLFKDDPESLQAQVISRLIVDFYFKLDRLTGII